MENQHNGHKTLFRRACETAKKSANKALVAATFAAALGGCGRDGLLKLPKPGESEPREQPDAGFVAKDAQAPVNADTQLPLDSRVPNADAQPKQDTSPAFAQDAGVTKDSGIVPVSSPDATFDILTDTLPGCVPMPSTQPGPQPSQTDAGAAPAVTYSYTINSLIGDNVDRTLFDRGKGVSTYPMGSDTDVNANPFTDGTGTGNLGPTDTSLYRITGDMFPPFAAATITDNDSATSYQAQQNVWVSGNSHYSDSAAAVVGTLNSVSYTMKFSGASDDFGIPVCTTPTNTTNYMVCDTDYQTATHKVRVPFLGDSSGAWLITGMTPPSGPLTSETTLASGGTVKLGKEIATGILNTGEALLINNLRFMFDGFNTDGTVAMSIVDPNCTILKRDTLQQGETKGFSINGVTYLLHPWKSSPGYIYGSQWVDMSVFSKEMTLTSGQALDQDNGANPNWTVYLGWKNQGASATDTNPDHLRTMILYAGGSDIAKLSSGGSSDLKAGDYMPIAQDPVSMQLQYFGLSDSASMLTPLTFALERNSNLTITVQAGQNAQSCTLSAPYVHVVSGGSGLVFTVDNMQGANGTASVSGTEFYVATSGASCQGSIGQLMAGALFMPTPGSYPSYLDYAQFSNSGGVSVNYPYAGAYPGSPLGLGTISYQNMDVGNMLPAGIDFVFSIGEDAGIALSEPAPIFSQFDLKLNGTGSTFSFDTPASNGDLWSKQGTIISCGAGPVTTPNSESSSSGCTLSSSGGMFRKPGYVNDRGSIFVSIGETTVQLNTATQLVNAQYVLNGVSKK